MTSRKPVVRKPVDVAAYMAGQRAMRDRVIAILKEHGCNHPLPVMRKMPIARRMKSNDGSDPRVRPFDVPLDN